jgi:shikimate dehydrogenase
MTKLAAIIGYPIGHSLSPAMYAAAFPAMGIAATYEAWPVAPKDVAKAIERLRGDDMLCMNVTVPHKEAVLPLLDEVEPTARAIGAVNCISKATGRLVGHNTDKYGYIRSLREAGCEPKGLRAVVLGVGGSARAVGFGLLEAGVTSLTLAGRNRPRVSKLANDLRPYANDTLITEAGWEREELSEACRAADLIVNCTPVGMRYTSSEGESPIVAAALRRDVWVSDLVFNPQHTELLRLAEAAGARPVGGLEMLVYQAEESIRLWCGRAGPVDIIRNACLEALAKRDAEPHE